MGDEQAAGLLGSSPAGEVVDGDGAMGVGALAHLDGGGVGFKAARDPIMKPSIQGMRRWLYSEKRLPCSKGSRKRLSRDLARSKTGKRVRTDDSNKEEER